MRVILAATLGACAEGARSVAAVLPDHTWETVSHDGGPTYAFLAGGRLEMRRQGVTLSGTYELVSDSTLVANVEGRIPGLGAGGPVRLPLRFAVRVLPPSDGGRERIEFRTGTVADTLVRVD
jgi:hypothetical protein